jgi:alkylation response protein AidB-like acyl-CoA dehydrogenase
MESGGMDERQEFRETVLEFARRALGGDVAARDRSGTFARDLWQQCADFGILGLPVPEEYGGSGRDALDTVLAMEALGVGCRDQGLLFSIHAHMWAVEVPIIRFGTPDQKRRYLPPLANGSWVGAHGMSEPDSGSDAYALRTRAERHGDSYVLNGTKMFVTNAPEADVFLIFATVDAAKGMWGISAFLVERESEGLTVGGKIEKMGLTTSPMSEVVLENCRVPASRLLGREGQGPAIFGHSMGWERSCILASAVGVMERQLATCVDYAKTRRQFGRPIGSFQLIASRVVDMKVRLETSRLLLHRTAQGLASGRVSDLDAAMAKLYISEAAVQSALDAIQLHGGYGYMREFEVERDLRDAIGARLYSGTSELQRLTIARHLGLPDSG